MSVCFIVAALVGQIQETPDIQGTLGRMSEVHSVELAVSPSSADITLIHLRDWHYVPFDEFVTDLDEDATRNDRRRAFRRFLKSVSDVQGEQRRILRRLHVLGIQTVFVEGLTADDERIFPAVCRSLWKEEYRGRFTLDKFVNGPNALSIRAPGQILAEGVRIQVRAADSDQTLKDCNPFDADGERREVSVEARERREDHMVLRMLEASTCVSAALQRGVLRSLRQTDRSSSLAPLQAAPWFH